MSIVLADHADDGVRNPVRITAVPERDDPDVVVGLGDLLVDRESPVVLLAVHDADDYVRRLADLSHLRSEGVRVPSLTDITSFLWLFVLKP